MTFTRPKLYIFFTSHGFILGLISAIYILYYFWMQATPGNAPLKHPLGWWGWFDQGQYLKSANAFLNLDFSLDKHFYPPLYPALGGIFLFWSTGHPFFLLNLLCLIWFCYSFIRFSNLYVSRSWTIFILFFSTIFNVRVFENFVIPWTTNLSVALISTGILGIVLIQDIRAGRSSRISELQIWFAALCLGLVLPTRPLDSVISVVFGAWFLGSYFMLRKLSINIVPTLPKFLLWSALGLSIGPILYFSFNEFVFGSPFGQYAQIAGMNGYFPGDLTEKFISIWLDGMTLYGEPNSGMVERFPWLLISLSGLIWILIKGAAPIKIIAISVCTLYIVYLPYGDLLPNGLWRYLNIHYFKWTFPFLGLFTFILLKDIFDGWKLKSGWIFPFLILLITTLFLISIYIKTDIKPYGLTIKNKDGDSLLSIATPNREIDFINIYGVEGGFNDVYFGSHKVFVDGHELKRIHDYRVIPLVGKIRILFIRPINGSLIDFIPDSKLKISKDLIDSEVASYSISMSIKKPFTKSIDADSAPPYFLGKIIDFSNNGSGIRYIANGFSLPEPWGVWSINNSSLIHMRLIDGIKDKTYKLDITYGALVNSINNCQRVAIKSNGVIIGNEKICVSENSGLPKLHSFIIPANNISSDGKVELLILTPDSTSPKSLNVNSDNRVLGIGLVNLRISN
jgi:hypothetical protein